MKCAPATVWIGAFLVACAAASTAQAPDRLDDYDLVWRTPSADASGSVPIGNGEVGCNAWVEADGTLHCYVSRTDSFSEAARLLKLGKVTLRVRQPLPGEFFEQRLCLREGCLRVTWGEGERRIALRLFVDAEAPVVHVVRDSPPPGHMGVMVTSWRTGHQQHRLQGEELRSSWTMQEAPEHIAVVESGDRYTRNGVLHHNASSVVPLTLEHQSLQDALHVVDDPLLGRTFGLWVDDAGLIQDAGLPRAWASGPGAFALRIAAPCVQDPDESAFRRRAEELLAGADSETALARTAAFWRAFWARSWIFVDGDGDGADFAVPPNDHPLRIGVDSNGQNRFVGDIEYVGVHGAVLEPETIRRCAGRSTGEPEPDLQVSAAHRDPLPWILEGPAADLSQGFTLEAWVRQDPDHPIGRIVDKLTAGRGDGFLLDTHPGSALRLIVGARQLVAEGALTPGRRHHVAATCEAATGRLALYLDGTLLRASDGGDPAPPSRLTQALILQRWVQACGGRGAYPIKFNGSIFTVEPKFTGGQPFDADWRRWGDCFWWQNTRLPYHAMLAQGDFEMMEPLFRLYERVLPLCRERARRYHGVDGAWFPETMTLFGTYANRDYGWDRTGHAPNEVLCPWWQWCWNPGLELLGLMLDRHDYAPDRAFARDRILPMADDVLAYFDSRFGRDERGVLQITPTQALETHWHGVVNDLPTVAGLHDVLDRLLAMPGDALAGERRRKWEGLRGALPPVPTREQDGVRMLSPAERYDASRQNVETPELYAVFPFRRYGLGRENLELARAAYEGRHDRQTHGWTQHGQFAALLGRVEDARQNLLARVRNHNSKHRFPAMWGPNFDWLPDQCHGSNLLHVTQLMLLQPVGRKLLVLPCWPREWDVSFRLRAPGDTLVEVDYRAGRIARLTVTPESRRADVVLPE